MLSWSCRRYRAAFTPGRPETDHPHRFRCRACGEYAAAMEKAAIAGRLVPISDRLRRRIESIPSSGAARVVRFPLPQVPLPDRLRERLREIPQQAEAPRRPPVWILDGRYAVAASYLLAVLLTLALGDPMERARQAMDTLSQELAAPIHRAESAGRDRLEALAELQEEIQDETRARYGEARRSLEESFSTLTTFRSRVTEVSRGLLSSDTLKIGPWASGSGPRR